VENKQTGILLHITSLPSAYGIGGLGKEAYRFIDYLKKGGFSYWQMLPLNFPGYGDSPYNAVSSFAGNPYLIDPETLFEQGLVDADDLHKALMPNTGKVNFQKLIKTKQALFRKAFQNFMNAGKTSVLDEYAEQESYWLKAFAVFCHLKKAYKNASWQQWKAEHRFYSETLFDKALNEHPDDIYYNVFLQYIIDSQMHAVKMYAEQQGIRIIGDLPLYVSLDSSDVWSRPELFELDSEGHPLRVAGVPPDAFSETGQLWGNPLYRWDVMRGDGFYWWKRRLGKALKFADRLRLDHFIGFVNFWAIDAKETSAVNGQWIPGIKYSFFDAILQDLPKDTFIAEDLGILTDEVNQLRDGYGFPGMIILQFCFQHDQNDILNFPSNKIIYTGTHDNQTTLGWYLTNQKQKKNDNRFMEAYLQKTGFLKATSRLTKANVSQLMIELALASPCQTAIIPMQDILALDDSARMNIPGIAEGNWNWRITSEQAQLLQ